MRAARPVMVVRIVGRDLDSSIHRYAGVVRVGIVPEIPAINYGAVEIQARSRIGQF